MYIFDTEFFFCLFFIPVPVNVARVIVTQRFADRLELSWEEVKSNNTNYILRHSSKAETTITVLAENSVMTHTVSSLSPGTRYSFTLYTVFEGVRSRGLTFTSVTGLVYLFVCIYIVPVCVYVCIHNLCW